MVRAYQEIYKCSVTVQTPPKKYDEILEAYHRSVSG